jgi:C6 transcription factor Pro1
MLVLTSFQLFNGGVSNWQVHLRAASDIVLSLYDIPPQDKLPSRDRNSRRRSSSSPESVGLKFFAGCIIWFDSLSCISTGRRPYLGDCHDRLLSSPLSLLGADIDLQSIAGCYNWVMMIITEIATLISESAASGVLPFIKRADSIRDRLEFEQAPLLKELEAMRATYQGWPPHSSPELYNKYTILAVTNVFASAARIYLRSAITSSPLSPPEIRPALELTIEAFRMIPDPRMVRAMVWALCVGGCMASSAEDQKFFADAASGAITEARSFGNSGMALEIMELSWKLQREREYLVDCASTIRELGTCVLLV